MRFDFNFVHEWCSQQIAYEYARRGACLSLVDIREEGLEAVAGKARLLGSPDVITIGADVSDDHHSQRFVHHTVDHFGRRKLSITS